MLFALKLKACREQTNNWTEGWRSIKTAAPQEHTVWFLSMHDKTKTNHFLPGKVRA